jgi:GAF domain-containing protein
LDEALQAVVEGLLARTNASRVTLRQPRDDDFFPISHEALAPGARSIRDVVAPNMPRQPVVLEVSQGRQVVQDDCASAFDDPDFQTMLELYGGMRAQIVTPVRDGDRLLALLSVHELRSTRNWTDDEIAACRAAAEEIRSIVSRHV